MFRKQETVVFQQSRNSNNYCLGWKGSPEVSTASSCSQQSQHWIQTLGLWVLETSKDGDFAGCTGNLLQCLLILLVISFFFFNLFLNLLSEHTLFLFMIIVFYSPLYIAMNNLALSSLLPPADMGKQLLDPTKAMSSWGSTELLQPPLTSHVLQPPPIHCSGS